VNFWTLLTFIFACSTVLLGGLLRKQRIWAGSRSYERGFATELAAARSAIELADVSFTGTLIVDENGRWMRELDSSIQYVGPPSDAIYNAWFDLIEPINLDLVGDEARDLPDTYIWPGTDSHFTGVTVYHSLHCLNKLRMAIYRDEYPFPKDPGKEEFTWIHLDHCIDFIRQELQCHGDLTPMKWIWSPAINRTVLTPEASHVCRNWDSIHQWAKERMHIQTEEERQRVPPRPTHGIHHVA